jgi:hypothetical protein
MVIRLTRIATLPLLALILALGPHLASATAAGSPWRLVWSTHFSVAAPLGSFSHCTGPRQATCAGLPASLRSQWWAYPDGSADTATKWHLRVGGYYSPSTTVWIAGGVMNIRLWRGTGRVHSAALLPKAAIGRTYGEYVETFRVIKPMDGYKSAHMLWPVTRPTDGTAHEIDYPEGGWGTPLKAFVHYATHRPRFVAGAAFDGTWTTTVIKWTPSGMSFYADGKLVGSLDGKVADVPMRWVMQNETQTDGTAFPPVNSSATMQIRYAAYYAWAG